MNSQSIEFYGSQVVAELRRHSPRLGADVGGENPNYARDDFLSAAREELEKELRGVIQRMQEIAKQPITAGELWAMVAELGKEEVVK